MFAPKNPDPKTGVNYERLGRAVEEALVKDYIYLLHSTRRQIWSSFVRGVFVGLGTVVGATLVAALLIGLLQQLGALPHVGQFFQTIGHELSTGTK